MTRRLIEMHAGVIEDRVVIVFPGAVNWLRFTPQQAKQMARKLWRLAEEVECGAEPGRTIAGALRPERSEVEAAVS